LTSDKIACIILAAGSSVRYGSPKQLAEFEGKSLIQRAVDEADKSNVDYLFLVLGNSSSEILEKINLKKAQVIFNKNFLQGISTSIKAGLANVPNDCVAVIIMVADQPFLTYDYLNRLIEESKKSPGKIVALSYNGEPRNPVLIPTQFSRDLESLEGDEGARSLIRKKSETILIDIPDDRIFFDVDTKDSLLDLQNSGEV
jgi:molybdenum cofactor cytidylyltransferase